MIPFLYFDLEAVIRNLLDIVIEPVVIEACCSGKQFKEIDLSKKGNLLLLSKINLGFMLRKKLIPLQSLMLTGFNRLTNSEKVQEILCLKYCTSCVKEAC